MKDFDLLKRTFPISQYERLCDGYDYIINHSTPEEREEWRIDLNDLQKTINIGEKYIYQVAKDDNEFKVMSLCFSNYAIIRKFIFKSDVE